ncbi:uncharacterized protein CDAR_183201 [Caerostris darwini]|uniref:G domain-containing protein n=1 Tax=Caerostris darwini TaxID=1538125 RepID=A0AAV4T213_9ARAC|nr:uncharacterized protein CDAR_183201 [Caerostris darwini]
MKKRGPIDTELISSTLDLLNKGEKEIVFKEDFKDIILVLGNTGSGKSTFTQWLAGDNSKLISKEVSEDTGEFIIVDNNRIGDTTVKSKTLFPELVVDAKTNVAYYDCPGFSDTRSTSNDIATTYFIKKVLDYAESVKMVFTISYPSVRKGVDRKNFMELVRHATDLVKDMDKFKNSIAIIATKVDNHYVKQGKTFVLVEDHKVIKSIGDFLLEVKNYMAETEKLSNVPIKQRRFNESAVKFLEMLLEKDNDHYTKIGIFRRPDEPGPLSNITLLQQGKKFVENIVYEKLNYTNTDNNDFGYTISEKSKNDVQDLIEGINEKVWKSVDDVAKHIQEYYRELVEKMRNEIKSLLTSTNVHVDPLDAETFSAKFNNGYKIASNLTQTIQNLTNAEDLAIKLQNSIRELNIDVPEELIGNIAKQGKYFNFLQVVSGKEYSSRPWSELFRSTVMYLSESRKNIQEDINNAVYRIKIQIQADFKNIVDTLKKQYREIVKLEEIQKLPNKLNSDYNIMKNLTDEMKHLTSTVELVKTFLDRTGALDINISKDSTLNIRVQGKYLEFLRIVSDKELDVKPFHMGTAIPRSGKISL